MKTFLNLLVISILVFTGCKTSKSDKEDKNTNQSETTSAVQPDTLSGPVTAKKFSGEEDISRLEQVSGTLNYSGNEPFARPTIFVSDTVAYVLEADKQFLDSTYSAINGKDAVLYGLKKKTGETKTFEIHYYEVQEE